MINIAVFASGTGTNFIALHQHIRETKVPIKIACLICDQPNAPVVTKADELGIPVWTHHLREFEDKASYEKAILRELKKYNLALIILAGYMKIVTKVLLEAYPHAILNIHPALLPSFPGRHGIEDAFEYGVKITGVTIHWIDGGIDTGPIIAQQPVPILQGDDVEHLAQRIHQVEHDLYFKSI